jgi:hypothetical protein
MASSVMLRCMALDVSKEVIACIVRLERLGELGTTLTVTSQSWALSVAVRRFGDWILPSSSGGTYSVGPEKYS